MFSDIVYYLDVNLPLPTYNLLASTLKKTEARQGRVVSNDRYLRFDVLEVNLVISYDFNLPEKSFLPKDVDLVTPSYILDSFRTQRNLNYSPGSQFVFSGVYFYFLEDLEIPQVKDLVVDLGGTLLKSVDWVVPNKTYVVSQLHTKVDVTQYGCITGVKVVVVDWVYDCIQFQMKLDERNYRYPQPNFKNENLELEAATGVSEVWNAYFLNIQVEDPTQFLKNYSFYFCPNLTYHNLSKGQVVDQVERVGGKVVEGEDKLDFNVFIASVEDGEVYQKCLQLDLLVGSLYWVEAMFKFKSYLPLHLGLLFQPRPKLGVIGFYEQVFTISGYSQKKTEYLKLLITQMGGKVNSQLNSDTSHLITNRFEESDIRLAAALQFVYTNHQWVEQCYREWRQVQISQAHLTSPKGMRLEELVGGISYLPTSTPYFNKTKVNLELAYRLRKLDLPPLELARASESDESLELISSTPKLTLHPTAPNFSGGVHPAPPWLSNCKPTRKLSEPTHIHLPPRQARFKAKETLSELIVKENDYLAKVKKAKLKPSDPALELEPALEWNAILPPKPKSHPGKGKGVVVLIPKPKHLYRYRGGDGRVKKGPVGEPSLVRTSSQADAVVCNPLPLYLQFSGFRPSPKQLKVLESHGIHKATSLTDFSCLITNQISQSLKLLIAIAQGKPVCKPEFLDQLIHRKSLSGYEAYLMEDVALEAKFRFQLKVSLASAKEKPLLQGFQVYLAPNYLKKSAHSTLLLNVMKAEVLEQVPDLELIDTKQGLSDNRRLVLADEEDVPFLKGKLSLPPHNGLFYPIFKKEALLLWTLRQELSWGEEVQLQV